MNRLATLLLAGALGAGFGTHAVAEENESGHEHQAVTMDELPAPVKATFEREAKGGKIEELRKETRKSGKVIYEAEIVKNGKGREIGVNAQGKVVERARRTTRARRSTRRSEARERSRESICDLSQLIDTCDASDP